MSFTIQKANFWKRISAYLFDVILTVMLVVGLATAFSAILGYDKNTAQLTTYYEEYEEKFGVDFDITEEDYNKLSETEKENYTTASNEFRKDGRVLALYEKMFLLTLVIVSLSCLLGILVIQFIVPLFFHNGQTLGKKIFGVAVMRSNGVRVSNPVLFIRAIIGTYTIETMFPLALLIMIYFGLLGIVGTFTILLLLGLQIGVLIISKNNSTIHDLLSDTVVVDMASQRIFESNEALLAYKQAEHEKEVNDTEYSTL